MFRDFRGSSSESGLNHLSGLHVLAAWRASSAQTTRAVFSEGFAIGRILKGAIEQIGSANAMLTIAPHDAVVFTLEKTQ